MPGPASPATFQRPDLGLAYLQFDIMSHLQGFVGLNAMPMTTVGLQASNFSKVTLAQLLNDDRKVKRASGAGYARQDLEFEQDSYSTDERGVEELLDDRDRAIFAYTGIQFEQLAADRAVAALLRNLEVEIAGVLQDSATYSSAAVAVAWATKATATPASDVLAGRETFKLACGVYPNTITMSEKSATNVVQTAEMQDFIKYTSGSTPGELLGVAGPGNGVIAKTAAILAMAFRIDNVNISPAISNTANSGATPVLADIWASSKVSLSLTPQGGDLRSMGFGRTFAFEQMVLEQYRDERVRGDVMRARFDVDVKVIQSACLHILTGT